MGFSIIDLTGGWQPLYNEDKTVAVIQNGEDHNYLELQADLEAKGHVFRTHSDTEVLAHGYEEWGGPAAATQRDVRLLRLRFETRRVFHRARPLRPVLLYYFNQGGRFLGSEAKSLLQSVHVEARPNTRAIALFLTLRNVPEPHTSCWYLQAAGQPLPPRKAGRRIRDQAVLGNPAASRHWRHLQER